MLPLYDTMNWHPCFQTLLTKPSLQQQSKIHKDIIYIIVFRRLNKPQLATSFKTIRFRCLTLKTGSGQWRGVGRARAGRQPPER